MITAEKTIDGFHFTITHHFEEKENKALLIKQQDAIKLRYQFSGIDNGISVDDSSASYDIEFMFEMNYLKSFSSHNDFDLTLFPNNLQSEVCCNTQMILHEVINCKLKGDLRNIFLVSKALSLLLCFHKSAAPNKVECSTCKFLTKPVEQVKMHKAKEIILSRLNNPPTISELSLQIGINQCYLKKGFKELFGSTVYDFIQEQRMLKAKMLLKMNTHSIAQVADAIGFSSAGNFSSAFKKHVGVFPSEMRQN